MGRGKRAQRSGSDGGTDDVLKGQKVKRKWNILLGRRGRISKQEVTGVTWWEKGELPSHK